MYLPFYIYISVNSATSVREKGTDIGTGVRIAGGSLSSKRELSDSVIKNSLSETKHSYTAGGSKVSGKNVTFSLGKPVKPSEDSDSDPDIIVPNNISSTVKAGLSSRKMEDHKSHAKSEMLSDDDDSVLPSEVIAVDERSMFVFIRFR